MSENRLKIIRDDLGGISQAKLADITGIPLYKIKYAETSNDKISREIAKTIEEKLGHSRLWVLTGEGEKFIHKGQELSINEEMGEQVNHHKEYPAFLEKFKDDKELIAACLILKKIFDDKVHKKAICENLLAFELSIDDRKEKEEANKKLQDSLKENKEVQNRISKLEELCSDLPNIRIQLETLQGENRSLRAENNRLKATYENPSGDDRNLTNTTTGKSAT